MHSNPHTCRWANLDAADCLIEPDAIPWPPQVSGEPSDYPIAGSLPDGKAILFTDRLQHLLLSFE